MEFTRRGTYDPIANDVLPYEGNPYPTVKNDPDLALGIGKYQPVPVFAVITDLGGKVPNLRLAAGLYAPNAYPFRGMCTETANGCTHYQFNGDFNEAPSPARYDIIDQDAAVIMPSIAASYRVMPNLDVGARFSAGNAHLKSTIALWGTPGNVTENVKQDATFHVDVKDNFVPAFGLGVTYRPTPMIELAAAYSSEASIVSKGDAVNELGPDAGGVPGTTIGPVDDEAARCATGGTTAKQKVCVDLALPMTATIGGRYKFLGADGKQRGDVELDLGWENWSAQRATDFRVVVDAQVFVNGTPSVGLRENIVPHGLKDVFTARVGGSYSIPVQGNGNEILLRGGVGYDTAAAKTGWYRADIDGAARTTVTVGAGYKAKRFAINIGGGAVLEGTSENAGECNPVDTQKLGCNGDGVEHPVGSDGRQGPDPINPLVNPNQQIEAPVNRGTFKSHYVMFMLGFSTWF
jgi:long-subunit fatty acid transport protein